MKNEMVITVSGPSGSGKSRLAYLLKTFLREVDFEVELQTPTDFENEADFDLHMDNNFDEVIPVIQSKSKILIRDVQTNRSILSKNG